MLGKYVRQFQFEFFVIPQAYFVWMRGSVTRAIEIKVIIFN
jgi:hypothetical protein